MRTKEARDEMHGVACMDKVPGTAGDEVIAGQVMRSFGGRPIR